MDAICNNCDYTWTLTKDLEDYAEGGPECPDCGSTNITAQAEQPSQPQQAQAQGQQQAARPATQQQQQQGGNLPATGGELGSVARQAGSEIVRMQEAGPRERADIESGLMGLVGEALTGAASEYRRQRHEQLDRAEQRAGESIQPAQEYPTCASCDGVLTELPPEGTEFACPHCGQILVA